MHWQSTEPEFLKLLRSPRIDSREPVPLGYVALRAGYTASRQPYSYSEAQDITFC